jgi:hypothetical protein
MELSRRQFFKICAGVWQEQLSHHSDFYHRFLFRQKHVNTNF